MATKKPEYSKPASQVDLEERLAKGNRSDRVLSTSDSYEAPEDGDGRDFRVEDNDTSGYVGVSAEYATYANETEKPGVATKGVEAEIFESFAAALSGEVPEVEEDEEEDDDEVAVSSSSSSTSSSASGSN